MSRVVLSCVDRAQREVLTLELALYHAARDYPGGAAAIAATTGRNATTLQHKLSPTHPSHTINIQEFGEILELTKDRRIDGGGDYDLLQLEPGGDGLSCVVPPITQHLLAHAKSRSVCYQG